MDAQEREALLLRLPGTERRVYAALKAGGKMTDAQLRVAIESAGSGVSKALVRLLEHGLIRHAGWAKRERGGKPPMRYEVTPDAAIEETKTRYETKKPRRRGKQRRVPASRVAELRKQEKGDYLEWYRTRKRLIELVTLLIHVDAMAFWENAPTDELEQALEEILDLLEWSERVVAAIGERKVDDGLRRKIEKLLQTSGRTPEEIATGRKLAETLQARL